MQHLHAEASSSSSPYPARELEFAATRAWNYGVFFHRTRRYEQAERFLGICMNLAPHVRYSSTKLSLWAHITQGTPSPMFSQVPNLQPRMEALMAGYQRVVALTGQRHVAVGEVVSAAAPAAAGHASSPPHQDTQAMDVDD